jgi:hypothetical protein
MTRVELEEIAGRHGIRVDGVHAGAGKFCDLYLGTGASRETLIRCQRDLELGGLSHTKITYVDNPEHPQHGQPMLEVPSFWNE